VSITARSYRGPAAFCWSFTITGNNPGRRLPENAECSRTAKGRPSHDPDWRTASGAPSGLSESRSLPAV
jgi:hypothetical protein